MSIRLPRIEALIGQQLERGTESDLAKLTAGGVPEDTDLDYKQQLYGSSDSDKRDLAGDVAALANSLGGLLLIGVQENGTGNAAQLSPVAVTGQENVRIRQIVATYVAPIPQFEIFQVPSVNAPSNSYLLLVVAPSAYRPHAVRVNDALRYPVRDGPRIRYLTESEVADMYRGRFLTGDNQVARLDQVEKDGLDNLAPASSWLTLSIVPTTPARFAVNAASMASLRQTVSTGQTGILSEPFFYHAPQATASVRRGTVSSNYENGTASDDYIELHADGSFFIARRMSREGWPMEDPAVIPDETMVLLLVESLAIARHTIQTEALGSGDALARANVFVPQAGEGVQIQLVHVRAFGNTPLVWEGSRPMRQPIRMTHTISLEALADPRELLVTARILATEIFQSVGLAEVPQISQDGELRRRYFIQPRHQALATWAGARGIRVTDSTLPPP